MGTPADQRISPNRVVLILALLTAAWLVFLYSPRRKEPPPPMAPVMAESKLRAVGLADNPDWEGLPEFFAIWADRAEWKDGRTRFAYWHPVMKTFSYYFEATRSGAGYRFKEITEPSAPDHVWGESLGEGCPIRFYHSTSFARPALPVPPPVPVPPDEKAARPETIKIQPEVLKLPPPPIKQTY